MTFRIKLFLAFILFAIFITFFIVYSFSTMIESKNFDHQLKSFTKTIEKKDTQINSYITGFDKALYAILKNHDFKGFEANRIYKKQVEELFEMVRLSHSSILQIRYIDNSGDELINVSSSQENKLRNKQNRYYFKEIKKQTIGSFWYSKFDLNMKDGKIEKPIKRVIRLGLNLENGILIINISLKPIVDILKMENYNIFLVDKNGDILIDTSNNYYWSKYLGKDIKIGDILKYEDQNFLTRQYFYTDNFISKKLTFANDDGAVIILLFPIGLHEIISEDMSTTYIIIAILTIIISILMALGFSKPIARLTMQIERANRKLDKKVERRTKKLKKSLEIIDKYVIRSTTDADGKIIDVSDAFCKISGYKKEELIGQPHSIVRHPDMKDAIFKQMWKTITQGKPWSGVVKNRAKNGEHYWVKAYIEPKFNEDNKIIGYTAIRNDITSNILLERLNNSLNEKIKKEVEKNTKQLEIMQKEQLKSVKLSSIGSLAAGITHEINTPLTYIKGNLEMLEYDIEDVVQNELKQRMLRDTQIIIGGVDRIANIVEAMKEVSQNSSEEKSVENIYATIITSLTVSYNTSKMLSKIYLNEEAFNIDMDKNKFIYKSLVQRQRVEQVWIVIIRNALDELIKLQKYEDRRIDINIYSQDKTLVIKFKDNAGGIDDAILDKIFEPFSSLKEHGGIGIGLNIAKKIIEDQDGEIKAYNEDKCAVFEIRLELVE